MTTPDPIFAAITGPGSPFEIGERAGLRQFVNAPPDLNMLIEAARVHGEKTFIVEGERRLSFNDVFAMRDALVPVLGIARGDRVAICMRNRPEWMIAYLAVVRAGGIAALLNSRGAPGELVAMVEEVSPALVLVDAERAAKLREGGYAGRILEAGAFPSPLLFRGGAGGGGFPPGASLVDSPHPNPSPEGEGLITNPDDPVTILFTSGTTGRFKGATLTHRNLITGLLLVQMSGVIVLHQMAAQYGMEPHTLMAQMPQGAVLQVYPLFHISGLGSAFLSPMFAGSKLVMLPRWDPEEALALIAREKVSQMTAVPTMLWDVLNRAKLGEADLSSVKNIGTGGQALPTNLLDAIHAACPQALLGTGYGMTETAGSVAQMVGEEFLRHPSSAGKLLSLVDMRIEGPDGGALPTGEAGEIVVRGPMVMQGYWNLPEETAAVLSPDGWLKTGDIGTLDADGFVTIVDRKKDMVISGGENIFCVEVEQAINALPEVAECAAFGIPDDRMGEMLVAVVVGKGLTGAAIQADVAGRLARYKVPGQIAFSPEPLPRNAVGKIDKIKLRAMWPELMGELA